jgi:hypothetical protein
MRFFILAGAGEGDEMWVRTGRLLPLVVGATLACCLLWRPAGGLAGRERGAGQESDISYNVVTVSEVIERKTRRRKKQKKKVTGKKIDKEATDRHNMMNFLLNR